MLELWLFKGPDSLGLGCSTVKMTGGGIHCTTTGRLHGWLHLRQS